MTLPDTSDIDDDLIGDSDEAEVAKRRRVDLYVSDRYRTRDPQSGVSIDLTDVHAGVSIEWLCSVFGMANRTVKKRIAGLQPMKRLRGSTMYDLRQAAAYLVDPMIDFDKFVKTLRPEDLPPKLSKDYWDALLKMRKYQLLAGELWHTGDVLEVLGGAFKHIKESTQLWINTVERNTELSNKQREILVSLADQLLNDLHSRLVTMPDNARTASILEAKAIEASESEVLGDEPTRRGPGRPPKNG